MHERDRIFREKLLNVMGKLQHGEKTDAQLRLRIGDFVKRLVTETKARDWADLKERVDGPTYDAMLRLFDTESAKAAKAGDTRSVRAFEVLAISLIARRQYQADLLPGVSFLDQFIAGCAALVPRPRGPVVTIRPVPQ